MSKDDVENKFPIREVSFSLSPKSINKATRAMLRGLGNLMHKIGAKISRGPLAILGIGPGILLQESSTALVRTGNNADGDSGNIMGMIFGAAGTAVTSQIVFGMTPLYFFGGLVAGGVAGGLVAGPVAWAGVWAAARAVKALPKAIYNTFTVGKDRSLDSIKSLTRRKEPKIINPVSDRGIEPAALPAPPAMPALLKLTGETTCFKNSTAVTQEKVPVSKPEPPTI